jgi:hypothetical protein
MDTASSHYSKGYAYFRVPTMAPGPTLGEDVSLQVGPKLALRINVACLVSGAPSLRALHQPSASGDVCAVSSPSVTLTATSVFAAD